MSLQSLQMDWHVKVISMKPKIILFMILLLGILSTDGMSQAISQAEYYFDSDPGEGNGIPFTINNSGHDRLNESVTSNINTTSILAGTHRLFIRFRNTDGSWSTPLASVISLNESLTTPETAMKNISEMEYYIGSDPGEGNGTSLTAADGTYNFPAEKSQGDLSTFSMSSAKK